MAWSTKDLASAVIAGVDCVDSNEPSLIDLVADAVVGLDRCDAMVVNRRRDMQ